eukprot:COSAG01_NODE_23_length_37704_cov_30.005877_32_plen_110_part_00
MQYHSRAVAAVAAGVAVGVGVAREVEPELPDAAGERLLTRPYPRPLRLDIEFLTRTDVTQVNLSQNGRLQGRRTQQQEIQPEHEHQLAAVAHLRVWRVSIFHDQNQGSD